MNEPAAADAYRVKKLYAGIGKLITSSLQLAEILEGIMQEVRRFFNPQNWSLLRLDPATNQLFFVLVEGIDKDDVERVRIDVGEGVAGTVAQTGQPLFVPDAAGDPRFSDKVDRVSGFRTTSVIAVPVVFRGKLYGVLELINRLEGGQFTDDDFLVLQTIADYAAIAFANAQLYEHALYLTNTDPLTGASNRLRLDKLLERWEKNEERRDDDHATCLIAAVVDLNGFKEINDTHGHAAGDAVLVETGRLLRSAVRANDLVFRTGGDEFLLLVRVNPQRYSCDAIAGRLRGKLAALCQPVAGRAFQVSFASGIATGPLHAAREVIHAADIDMYRVKQEMKAAGGA